jgi:diguanylate cyclase (GGDEF)-like protein
MRRSLLTVLAGALALLVLGVSTGLAGHAGALAGGRDELARDAVERAQVLDAYFARSSSIILLTAHNPAFRQFYEQPGARDDRVRRGSPILDAAYESLAYLEELYPNSIGEACFIDASGFENVRTVRGERATYEDLSDESKNPFFAPSFALQPGQVHQAKPYVSPDTDEWVVANSTLVPMAGKSKPAFVHFEVTIESFRREANSGADGTVLVIDAETGGVLVNSSHPQRVGAPLGDPGDRRFRGLVSDWADAGGLNLDGHQAAYKRISATPGNVNDWYVVSVANAKTGPLTGVGLLPFIVVVASLSLIVFLLVALRRGQSVLISAANTDVLTGLYNRRRLIADLETELARATDRSPLQLILCDLNGFKAYNDTFGHPAGDALLARLGACLARDIAGRGQAYRIGGDEFCVLARGHGDGLDELAGVAAQALTEHGDGFMVTAARGAILLPTEASTPAEAMRVVDIRMYENKNDQRVPADAQTANALLRAMHEREPEWAVRMGTTADLAARTCELLELPPAEATRIRQAAQLHDIGKVGIPDMILRKPGPLTSAEWYFAKQAPSVGERITAAAPALARLAPLILSSREHYDGTGYPDLLAGEDIPLGARIIAACAAVAAMTSDRPHAQRQSLADALEELNRAAGTQFDPRVVAAVTEAALLRSALQTSYPTR